MGLQAAAAAMAFEQLVERILTASGFAVAPVIAASSDNEVDCFASLAAEQWAVQVKFYRTDRAQVRLIESAASRLLKRLKLLPTHKGMLVMSSFLGSGVRASLENRFGIVFIDRADLFVWAARDPALIDELAVLLESSLPASDAMQGREVLASTTVLPQPATAEPPPDTQGTQLCNQLRALKRGRGSWSSYEVLCQQILKYLFTGDLQGWHAQKRTDDGLNRYDLVCRIKPTTEFWRFVLEHLNSRYAMFEFKNYTGKVKQGQVLTTEKYLLERALRRTAIIFSRNGADDGAIGTTQGAMREHGKLMLVLSDDDVCHMLNMKERGEDPSDFLFDRADEFLLSLPR
jgi:hypothetical protein